MNLSPTFAVALQITAQQIESLRIELDDRTEALHEAARAEEDLIEHAEALEARVSELQAMVDTCWEGKCSRVTALSATIRQLQVQAQILSSFCSALHLAPLGWKAQDI